MTSGSDALGPSGYLGGLIGRGQRRGNSIARFFSTTRASAEANTAINGRRSTIFEPVARPGADRARARSSTQLLVDTLPRTSVVTVGAQLI